MSTLKLWVKTSFCLQFSHLKHSLQALVSRGTFLALCMPFCHRACIFLISKGTDCYQLFFLKERLATIKPLEQKVFPNPPRAKALIHMCQLKSVSMEFYADYTALPNRPHLLVSDFSGL